ncbi:DUF3549 family protein [Alteromonas sp. CYL-A6]|uniref:DUF3549 family protein n=1 Tax=Alteromonas nitratireducens TaxID=3390813 RepID=UPI0034AE53D5
MSATSIDSISEFLLTAGTEYRVFDMGRGIYPVPAQTFLEIENAASLPPHPRQQHAWYGLVFWNKQSSSQHYIWFIKLPLDEQGLVVSAARNHFLQIIVDALGSMLQPGEEDADHKRELPDNPYSFVPPQGQLAQFNALVRKHLGQPQVQGVSDVVAYIKAPALHQWETLPVQAIHDVAVRLDEDNAVTMSVVTNFGHFAPDFQNALMTASENTTLPDALCALYLNKLDDPLTVSLDALRGLTSRAASASLRHALGQLLSRPDALSLDTLSVIAGRHFVQFDDALTLQFLECTARADADLGYNGALFAGLFSDLVQIPALRAMVLATLRSPDRSQTLAAAIGKLFSATTGSTS